MNKNQDGLPVTTVRQTKAERLYEVLSDYAWHTTRELVRRVGHTFAVAKRKLAQLGIDISKKPDPGINRHWLYRLDPPNRIIRRAKTDKNDSA